MITVQGLRKRQAISLEDAVPPKGEQEETERWGELEGIHDESLDGVATLVTNPPQSAKSAKSVHMQNPTIYHVPHFTLP